MPDTETVRTWQGRTLLDRDGSRIGTIDAIYLDDRTGQPEWALVNTGLFGTKASFVPLVQAFQSDNDVLVPYDKQLVRDAPRVDVDQRLSEAEEQQLWRHYGLDYGTTDRSVATGRNETSRGTVGQDVSGPTTDDAMTRSEEELRVGTAQRERGRVRLRKYVTTEQVQRGRPRRLAGPDRRARRDQQGGCGAWARAGGGAGRQPPSSTPSLPSGEFQDPADGSDSSGNQRAQSAGRADQRAGKADKNRESHRDKAGSRGKDKPNKSKGKDE